MKGEALAVDRATEGALAVRDLPSSIRVGCADVTVIVWTALGAAGARRWGEWSAIEQVIRIQENMPSGPRAVEAVLHEVLHAIWWAYSMPEEKLAEEQTVSILGAAMTALWRDNPALLAWVARWSSAVGSEGVH